jgi:hypothetical protein
MGNSIVIIVYGLANIVWAAVVLGIILVLHKGLRTFFDKVFMEKEIGALFVRMTEIALFLGGIGAAIGATYESGADKNWLTLVWSIANQVDESIKTIIILIMVLIVAFLLFFALGKYGRKDSNG